ncbi:MAG TPA: (d)CMP kinase, partial [Actinomycetota bacterium]
AGIHLDDEDGLAAEASTIEFWVRSGHPDELAIGDAASPADLTSLHIEENVSTVSRHPAVRRILRDRQRTLGARGSVMEGRDIGTVVFPDADVKVFLSAAPDVRAGRRSQEEGRGEPAAQAVSSRDEKDARTNPFVPADDAFVVDTTNLSPDQVFDEVLGIIESREPGRRLPVEPAG